MPSIMYSATDELDRCLEDFKRGFEPRDLDRFDVATAETVKIALVIIQRDQERVRELINLPRMLPFIQGMEEFQGALCKVVDGSKAAELMAYVWGPIQFLVQVSRLPR